MDVERVVISLLFVGVPMAVLIGMVLIGHLLTKQEPAKGSGLTLTFVVALGAGFITWWVWLSWGDHYQNELGQWQGPYRPWQVVACGLTMVAVVVALGLWSRWRSSGPFLAAYGAIAGFAFAWCYEASQDETGLFAFGLLMLLAGTTVGLSIVAGVVAVSRNITYARRT